MCAAFWFNKYIIMWNLLSFYMAEYRLYCDITFKS